MTSTRRFLWAFPSLTFYLFHWEGNHIVFFKGIKCGQNYGKLLGHFYLLRAQKVFYDYYLHRETNVGQNTTRFKWLILWNLAWWKWLNPEPEWREKRSLKCREGCRWPVIQYHLFKKLHMFNLCQQLFHAAMCAHSIQSSPPLWTIRALLISNSLMLSWNVTQSAPHTLHLSLAII